MKSETATSSTSGSPREPAHEFHTMRTLITRRHFVKRASAVGAALMAPPSARLVASEVESRAKGKTFRIGCLNVAAYSHLPGWWGPLINPRPDSKETPYTAMRMTHCWELAPERAKHFADQFNCVAVKQFDDMVGKVDGIISGGYHCHGWNHILHEPYLKAGLPNLINRPLSNSVAKARKIIETARQNGAKILNPSAYEHNNAMARAQAWVKGKKVISYSATTGADGLIVTGSFFGEAAIQARNNVTMPVATSFDGIIERAINLDRPLHVLATAAASASYAASWAFSSSKLMPARAHASLRTV